MLQPGNSGDPTLAIAETITQRGIRYATAKRFAPPKIAPFNQGSPDGERGSICPQAPSKLAFLTGVQQQPQMNEDCPPLSIASQDRNAVVSAKIVPRPRNHGGSRFFK